MQLRLHPPPSPRLPPPLLSSPHLPPLHLFFPPQISKPRRKRLPFPKPCAAFKNVCRAGSQYRKAEPSVSIARAWNG